VPAYLYADHQRILLIDPNQRKQALRSSILRNYEIKVDAASDMGEAMSLWRTHAYDLVLFDGQQGFEEVTMLSTEMRRIKPKQRIALLVGPPAYIRELGKSKPQPASLDFSDAATAPTTPPADGSTAQWQATVHRLVTHWYSAHASLLKMPGPSGRGTPA